MNTCKSARLQSSSCAPAIQYSRSGECMAVAQHGSSSSFMIGSVEPVKREERKASVEEKWEGLKSRGNKSCDSRRGENCERKVKWTSSVAFWRASRRGEQRKSGSGMAGIILSIGGVIVIVGIVVEAIVLSFIDAV